jgi:hypothetical protein
MDKKQLIIIVITIVISELVKRLASFIADKLKKATETKKAKTIVKILLNKFLIILFLQSAILYFLLSYLLKLIYSNVQVTNYSVFLIVFAYSIVLRVGYNTLKALANYVIYSIERYKNVKEIR